jgi:uncharacterized membrane protein YqjE
MISSNGDVPGLRDALARMLATLLDIGRGRLELVAVEIEEERLRLVRLWMVATCTLFFAFVGVVSMAAWIVLLCEPADRATALGMLTGVFAAAGALGAWQWRRLGTQRPPLLHATLAELRKDGAALQGHAPP